MRGAVGLVLAAVAVAAACASRPPAPPPVPAASDARAVLERQAEGTRTLRALFSFEVRGAGGLRESGRGALLLSRPDRLRLQLFSLGFVTVYDYVADGGRWRARFPLEGKTERGRFDDPAAAATARWDLRPLFFRDDAAVVAVEPEGELRRVRLESGREVRVSIAASAVVAETIPSADGEPVEVRYGDLRPVEGLPLPFRIEVEDPGRGSSLAIEIESYERNVPVDAGVFD